MSPAAQLIIGCRIFDRIYAHTRSSRYFLGHAHERSAANELCQRLYKERGKFFVAASPSSNH